MLWQSSPREDWPLELHNKRFTGFAFLSLTLAILNRADGFVPVAAAFTIAGLYGFLRIHWRLRILEDATAIALIVAYCLLGVSLNVDLPEFYMSAFGLYLGFQVLRKAGSRPDIRAAKMLSPPPPGRFKLSLQFVWSNRLPIALIVMMVGYPVWGFSHSLNNAHIYYLGGATVALLYLFLVSSQQALLVWTVCALFVQGVMYLLLFVESGENVNLFLVFVGALIIVIQALVSDGKRGGLKVAKAVDQSGLSSPERNGAIPA